MKYLQFKFWLILGALVCSACAGESIGTAQSNTNRANAIVNATPTPTPTATTANAAASRPLDVPYVPTHEMVVDEMLKMAKVKGTDVLYDLGSGDGRIPITAAKRFGTRGVGIDIDSERVKEANENAVKAGVTDKVKFIQGDLFKENFGEATVVTLYLLPDINLKLRPQLLSQLKPGTRVVSHNYDMGDWQPEQMKKVTTPDGVDHYVYYWRVPGRK